MKKAEGNTYNLSLKRKPHRFITADKNYPYVFKTYREEISSRILAAFVCAVAPTILRIIFNIKISGKENLKHLNKGAIAVCNHVHPLDCVALACAFWKRDTYFLSQKENFSIPFVRHIIRKLKAVPVPDTTTGFIAMLNQLKPKIENGAIFQIYPEGSLITDCTVLREFKSGAFEIADMLKAPVIPCVICISVKNGRISRELKVGKPISADLTLQRKLRTADLESKARASMEKMLGSPLSFT